MKTYLEKKLQNKKFKKSFDREYRYALITEKNIRNEKGC